MRISIPVASLLLAGCASVGGMRTAPLNEGASWAVREPEARVREAACESLRSYGMYLLEVGAPADAPWTALAQKTSLWSYGEYVRVTVLPTDSTGTTVVYLLTRRLLATNVTATNDWSDRLVPRMQEVLAGQRAIRPAPCEPKRGVRQTSPG
jgi:hypothetical protein